jgi:DNA-binding NarL/FixJ family response regulator
MSIGIDRSACPAKTHGTVRAYSRHGCRCPDARAANTAACHRYQANVRLIDGVIVNHRCPVDPIAIELACSGQPRPLGVNDRQAAIRTLRQRGHSARNIARTLGISMRTVQRHLAMA